MWPPKPSETATEEVEQGPKVFDFNTQLLVGNEGERIFFDAYHNQPLTKIDNHFADFATKEGKIVELKTDTYPMEKTKNFYFERWSDFGKQKPGSVWQSLPMGVEILCYLFLVNKVYFEFTDLPQLQLMLDDYIKNKSYIIVRNKWGVSHGYKVPREVLQPLWKAFYILPKKEEKE